MKTVNQIRPTYTHYLEKELKQIQKIANRESKETLVSFITTLVKPAATTYVNKNGTRLPTKKRKFLKIINSPRMTNDKVVNFCINSINKARITPIKYDNLPTE